MTIIAEAFVRIRPDDKDFPKQVETSAQKAAQRGSEVATKELKSGFGRAGRESHSAFLGAFSHFGEEVRKRFFSGLQFGVGAFTGIQAFSALEKVFGEGFQSEKLFQTSTAQLNQVLKTTRGVAGESADSVNKLSEKIATYSGETVNALRNSQVMLLGFTNIRDVAGKNNDIFGRASVASEDLAKRYGLDVSTAARTLGRALNDPARGLLLLRRAGIQLTAQQADAAKKLAAHGKILEAQKVILKAVEQRVGGAADAYGKTLPGQVDRAREKFNEFSRHLTEKLLPGLVRVGTKLLDFATRIGPNVSRAFSTVGQAMSTAVTAAAPLVSRVLSALRPVAVNLVTAFRNLAVVLQPLAGPVFKVLAVAFAAVVVSVHALSTALVAVTGFLAAHRTAVLAVTAGIAAFAAVLGVAALVSSFGTALAAATGIVKGLRGAMLLLNIVLDANPFIAIAALVIGLAAAFITAWKTSETFRNVVKTVFADIEHAIGVAISAIINAFRLWVDAQLNVFSVIAHGAASALGWIPELGPSLRGAVKDFDNFRVSVDGTLRSLATDAGQLGAQAGKNFADGFTRYPVGFVGPIPIGAKRTSAGYPPGFIGPVPIGAKRTPTPTPVKTSTAIAPLATSPDYTPIAKPTKAKHAAAGAQAAKEVIARAVPLSLTAAEIVKAFAAAVEKGRPGVLAEITKLSTQIRVTLNQPAAHGARDQLIAFLEKRRTALGNLADQYVTISKKIDDATQRLTDAQQAQADFFTNLHDTFTSAGDLANVLQGLSDQVSPGGEAVGGFLQHQVNQLNGFLSNLDALKAEGLDPSLIKQLAGQGADTGGRIAAGLVGASKAQIDRINALQAQLQTRATQGAQQLTNDFYQGGIDQLKDELSNDRKELAKISSAINNLEKSIGDDVGRGVAAGLNGVAAAANAKAKAKTRQASAGAKAR